METPLDINEMSPKPNNQFRVIAGVNLAILMIYIVAIDKDPYLAGKAILIVAQAILNLLIGVVFLFVRSKKIYAKPFLLSALLVLLVGFGACLARESF